MNVIKLKRNSYLVVPQQMSLFQRNILIVAVLISALLFYDVLLHSLWVFCHALFEWIELGLENAVHRIFQTNRKQSQLIVFYLFFLLASWVIYRLYRALPLWWQQFTQQCNLFYWQCRMRWHGYQRKQAKKIAKIQRLSYCMLLIMALTFLLTN